MGSFALENFAAIAQKYLSNSVSSNFYSRATFLSLIKATGIGNNNNPDPLQIGRPGVGELISGANIDPIQRMSLSGVNAYNPRVQSFQTANTATRGNGGRVALPDAANKTTAAHSQATSFRPEFRWTAYDTPIVIWHEDLVRALQKDTKMGQGLAAATLIQEATEIAIQDHLTAIAADCWTGSPANQSHDPWSAMLGIVEATKSNTGTYAMVDRSQSDAVEWRGQLDSTARAPNIRALIDDAKYTKNLAVKGNGPNLCLTTTALFAQFKAQALAGAGTIMLNGVPGMAKIGMTQECVMIDGVAVTFDPGCPTNAVVFFDTRTWKFIVHQDFNFKVGKFIDNTETGIAKDTYNYAYISTRCMLTCDNPWRNVRYSAVS